MKRLLTVLLVIAAMLVAVFVVTMPLHFGYYADWNGLLREIRERPGLKVIDGGRNEDLTLEEMEFTIRSARTTLVLSLSQDGVRRARDRADGIAMRTGRFWRDGNTRGPEQAFIRFDSEDWKQRGLPAVRTLGDMLDHFDAIAQSLLAKPPSFIGRSAPGDYIHLAFPRRPPAPDRPPPALVEEGFAKLWARLFR